MTRRPAGPPPPLARRLRLWTEAAVLFVGVPLAMAHGFGQYPLLPVLLGLAVVAAVLLALTPGFRFAELLASPVLGAWRLILGVTLLTGAACTALALLRVPGALLAMPLQRTELWIAVMIAYPVASVLPQELIYRPLFFRRYGGLFASDRAAVAANAVAFGLGHLFYANALTILTAGVAGAVFAVACLRHGSFLLAVVLHAIAGQIVFTAGLGVYSYHGAVGRMP